jgi:hypothetical protein
MMPNGSPSGVLVEPAFNPMMRETHLRLDLRRRNGPDQILHPRQIVGLAGEGRDPVYFVNLRMTHLAHQTTRLQPVKAFFDPRFLTELGDRPSKLASHLAAARRGSVRIVGRWRLLVVLIVTALAKRTRRFQGGSNHDVEAQGVPEAFLIRQLIREVGRSLRVQLFS